MSKYRTNELTNKPGGVTVMVEYKSGKTISQPRVKYPTAYIKKVFHENPYNVTGAYIEGDKENTYRKNIVEPKAPELDFSEDVDDDLPF
jgi:hypothetical protein